ncbi:MAG: caspase family protein [Sphaerochaeta sp.]|jgi:hypothetical protein|nr:caspase family protein [Sphaerochaeta sp.]
MKHVRLFPLLLAALLLSCELLPIDEGTIVHVGIGLSYRGCDVQVLPATINDAVEVSLALAQLFAGRAFSGELLIQTGALDDDGLWMYEGGSSDGVPTKERILERLGHWMSALHVGDLLIITYSGHGMEDGSLVLAPPGEEGSIFLEGGSIDGSLLLGTDELFTLLAPCKASVLLILDSCYSGNFVQEEGSSISVVERRDIFGDAYRRFFTNAPYNRRVFVLSATSSDHTSSEPLGGDHTHGYFTGALLEALGWECTQQALVLKRPFISSDWLYQYILCHQRIPTDGRFGLWYQHPQISGGPLDLVLVSR